jgi:hypothetical protein
VSWYVIIVRKNKNFREKKKINIFFRNVLRRPMETIWMNNTTKPMDTLLLMNRPAAPKSAIGQFEGQLPELPR